MAKTSKLQVVTKDGNDKVLNRTVSYVNPETSDSDLAAFATAYTGLSSRTFSDIYRIDCEDITNATSRHSISITPSVTISNGALTVTSPYFTPERETELIQKMLCEIVNNQLLDEYAFISDLANDGTGAYDIYGTLTDGTVITAENIGEFNNFYIIPTRKAEYLNFWGGYVASASEVESFSNWTQAALSQGDLVRRFSAGTLSIENGIEDLNTSWNLNSVQAGYTMPRTSYEPSAGRITFTPAFTSGTYAFILLIEPSVDLLNGGNALIRGLIGDGLFDNYYSDDESAYIYVITNPNYTE